MPTSGRASFRKKEGVLARKEKYKSYFQNNTHNDTGLSAASNSCERKRQFFTNSQNAVNYTITSQKPEVVSAAPASHVQAGRRDAKQGSASRSSALKKCFSSSQLGR